jgi:uncharacterized protein
MIAAQPFFRVNTMPTTTPCCLRLILLALLLLVAAGSGSFAAHPSSTPTTMDHPDILRILYHPRHEARTIPPASAQDLDIEVEDGLFLGCRLFTADKTAPTIIFFHGNGEIVADYDEIGERYTAHGLNFLATDYRGYGWSGGTPTTQTLLSDATTLATTLLDRLATEGYSGANFVMGRSLGSACAIEVMDQMEERFTGLILDSAFAETVPLAKMLGVDLLALGIQEEQTFNNAGKIAGVRKPTLLLHGQLDQLIPLWQAQKLHSTCGAKAKELQIVPGADHNTLMSVAGDMYFQVIKRWVDNKTGADDWRGRRRRFKQEQQTEQP